MEHEEALRKCTELAWACRHECQTILFNHCLEEGKTHLDPTHVKLMADCIEVCQTAADAMVRQSPMHAEICRACADICDACAQSCEAIPDCEEMKRCADICRQCATSCREMSAGPHIQPPMQGVTEDRIMA